MTYEYQLISAAVRCQVHNCTTAKAQWIPLLENVADLAPNGLCLALWRRKGVNTGCLKRGGIHVGLKLAHRLCQVRSAYACQPNAVDQIRACSMDSNLVFETFFPQYLKTFFSTLPNLCTTQTSYILFFTSAPPVHSKSLT